MARGRQVADAYIDVHGDLKNFSKDLRTKGRAAGAKLADSFSDGFEKRASNELRGRYDSVLDALYSGKKVDWDRAFGKFEGIDQGTQDRMLAFMRQMRYVGKITGDQYDQAAKSIKAATKNSLDGIAAEEKTQEVQRKAAQFEKDRAEAYQENAYRNARLRDAALKAEKAHGEAIKENASRDREYRKRQVADLKRYGSTLTGMLKNNGVANLERDFKRLGEAISSADFSTYSKGFKDLKAFKRETLKVADAMKVQGRVTETEYTQIRQKVKEVVKNQKKYNSSIREGGVLTRTMGSAVGRVQKAWARTDSTVRLVLLTILAAGDQVAVLGSGIASSLTAMVSSLSLALVNAVPLAAAFTALGLTVILAISAIDEMKATIPGLTEAFDSVADGWQRQVDRFAAAFGPALRDASAALGAFLGKIDFGTPLGEAAARVAGAFQKLVGSPGWLAFFDALTGPLAKATGSFGVGIIKGLEGILSLFAASGPAAAKLGADFESVMGRFAAAMNRLREDGTLERIFTLARESLYAFGDALGPLIAALAHVFVIGAEYGNIMLTRLGELATEFNDWTKSIEGQDALREWFENGITIMSAMKPIISGLATALNGLVTEKSIASFVRFSQQLGDALPKVGALLEIIGELRIFELIATAINSVGTALTPLGPAFSTIASIIGGALIAAVKIFGEGLGTVATAVAPLVEALLPAFASIVGTLVNVFGIFVPIVGLIATAFAQNLLPVIKAVNDIIVAFLPTVSEVASVLGDALLGAVVALQPAFEASSGVMLLLVEGFGELLAALAPVIVQMAEGLAPVIEALVPIVIQVVEHFATLAAMFITKVIPAILPIIPVISQLVEAFIGLLVPAIQAFGEIISAVLPVARFIAETVINAIVGAIEGMVRFLSGAVDVIRGVLTNDWSLIWSGVKDVVLGAVTAVANLLTLFVIGKAVQIVRLGVTAILKLFTTNFTAIRTFVSTIFNNIYNFMATALIGAQAAIATVLSAIATVFVTALTLAQVTTTNIFTGIRDFMSNALTTAKTAVSGALDAIAAVFSTSLTAAKIATTTIFTAIRAFMSTALQGAKAAIGVVLNAISGTFRTALTSAQTTTLSIFNAIRAFMVSALTPARAAITAALNAIRTAFSTSLNAARTVTSSVFSSIRSAISTAMSSIRSTVSSVLSSIRSTFSSVLNSVRSTASSVFSSIRSAISSAMSSIRSTVSSILNSIRSTFASVLSSIRSAATSAFSSIRSAISSAMSSIRSTVSSILSSIRSTFSSILNSIRSAAVSAFNSIRSAISSAMSSIRSTVSSALSSIRSAFSSAMSTLRNLASSGFRAIVSAARSGASSLMSVVRAIPGQIRSALGNLGGLLTSAGRDLIRGLINGIGSMGGALAGKARSMAGGAVSAIKSKLGIGSPSKITHQFGIWLGQGLENGIDSEKDKVEKVAASMSEAAIEALSKSKMYVAGQDAALGLADGLRNNSGAVEGALKKISFNPSGSLSRRITTMPYTPDSQPTAGSGGSGVTIQDGAIRVSAPQTDPAIVAAKVLDRIAAEVTA